MRRLRELLADPRRSQRGSVLSGVLIITAFLAIIAGALMTELSTNFLLSRTLVNRVATQATVDSAVESALNQLQTAPLSSGCPVLAPVSINGRTAAASYLSCTPIVDSRSAQFTRIAASNPFTMDGTHVLLPSLGRNEYLLSDNNTNLYEFPFGQATPGWTFQVEGVLTGPPSAMLDLTNSPNTILDLVPVTDPDDGGTSPNCGTHGFCVATLQETPGSAPQMQCFMQANGRVSGRVAAGVNFPNLAYFGDATGALYAYAPGEDSNCNLVASLGGLGQAIVFGPIVFRGASSKKASNDEIYVLASDGTSSQLVHYTFSSGRDQTPVMQLVGSLALGAANATGIAMQTSTLPGRLAITFAGGHVSVVQIQSDYSMVDSADASVGTGISGAPSWCACPGGDLIGVGGQNGLYVFDSNLAPYSSFAVSGTQINTAPAADPAGDWFFGADNSYVYEVQKSAGQLMTLGAQFGKLGARVGTSTEVGVCPAGLCIYTAVRNGSAFLIQLDARAATLTACITTSPPACSGDNPRLWTSVQIGVAASPGTVHVTGWSYYSP